MAFFIRLLQYIAYGALIIFAITVFLVVTSWVVYYIRTIIIMFARFWTSQIKSDAFNVIRKIFPPKIDKL